MKAVALLLAFIATMLAWGLAVGSFYVDPPTSLSKDDFGIVQFILFVGAIVSSVWFWHFISDVTYDRTGEEDS